MTKIGRVSWGFEPGQKGAAAAEAQLTKATDFADCALQSAVAELFRYRQCCTSLAITDYLAINDGICD